jgi:integrase
MYLKQVGGVYYFCARVPKDLIERVSCKAVKKSLRTRDKTVARSAAKAYALELERIAVYARSGFMDDKQLQKALQRLKDGFLRGVEDVREAGEDTVDILQRQEFKNSIPGIDVNYDFWQMVNLFGCNGSRPDTPKALAYYASLADFVRRELTPGAVYSDATRRDALRFVEENNLAVEIPPPGWFNENADAWFKPAKGDFNTIIRQLLKLKQELYDVEIQRLKGNYQNPYDAQPRAQQTQYLLSQAINDFCEERRTDKQHSPETLRRYRQHFNIMLEMLGDKDVTEYSRRDLDTLKSQLFERTANASKSPRTPKPLDKSTVNTSYMGKISALFKWLLTKDYVQKDLTLGLVSALSTKEKRERKRKAYDGDDLKKIFDLLPFNRRKQYLAWIPLLAAYTGARQNEICQLLTTDVKEEDGIPYISIINEDDDGNIVKHLKNESSRRKVPLHPVLIDMGFLDFVSLRKQAEAAVLFESDARHKPLTGANYTKIFQRFNRGEITNDPKKVFHSFRHLVQNELKQRGVPPAVYHSIVGHASDSEMDKVYTEDYSLQIKYEALMKLEHPTLDLQELRSRYSVFLT